MTDSETYKQLLIGNSNPVAFSTPSSKLNTSRPLPIFTEYDKNKLFQFKRNKPFNSRTLHPKSPVKSAPPISRVFPYRTWAPEKPHAISFRANEDQSDSVLCSRYYNSDCSELYFEQCFIIEKKLGEGSFGEVMQVRSRDNKQQYAVKRSRDKFKSESDRRRKLDEVKKHENLPSHPNCLKFIKAWEEKQRLYIQTELCSMSLQGYLEKHHFIPIYFIWKYFIDLLHGLQHIHNHGFIHFDVKPANIFISTSVDGSCKIGDFGLVVDRSNDEIDEAREGDNKYMAPELLDGIFTEKADVFSLGIAILEITCDLDLPSSGVSWQLLRVGYLPPECTAKMPFQLQTIIQWMMTPNFKERPTVNEVLKHPIIIAYKRRLKTNLFLQNCFWKVLQCFSVIFLFTVYAFFLPLKIIKRSTFKQPLVKQHSAKIEIKEWESSLSSEHSLLNDSLHDFAERADNHDKGHLLITPDVHNHDYSRFTPTPRNSSPLAHRTGFIGRRSPDLSPLSHNRARSCKANSTRRSEIVDDFDFFVSDHSEEEHSDDEVKERFLSSRPRNLLEMLNEVSDSDHSHATNDND